MAIHDEVLRAARRLCRERRGWTFTPAEVVRALPDLNVSSVRTHIVSRCCVNAPKNHPHKWEYFRRVRRGVYRLVHFPAGDHEELTLIWLWSEQAGVFSHQTALALHDLSDVLPSRVHLTLPTGWQKRRLRVPEGVVLHWGEVQQENLSWFGPVPTTAPARTLADCASANLGPELLRQAALDALARGLVVEAQLVAVDDALQPYGGLEG